MKQIRNVTHQPIKVPLAGGKTLHLGPTKTGQVSDDSVDRESFRKLVDAGAIEILGEGQMGEFHEMGSPPPEATHGHHPPTGTLTRGNR